MKITQLQSENVKRIKAVEIKPDGNVVLITGRNAQGKSSVLDSIAMAIGGKDLACEQPLRKGADKGKVVVTLDDLIVTRTFTPGGGGTLTVTTAEGAKYGSPQSVLDKLVGKLAFDPLAFARMDDKKQLETLKSAVGLDFSEMDRKRMALYDTRTEAGRIAKSLNAQLNAMPFHTDVGDNEVSVSKLMEELAAAEFANASHNGVMSCLEKLRGDQVRIENSIAELQARLKQEQSKLESVVEAISESLILLKKSQVFDVAPIKSAITSADATNQKIRENRKRQEIYCESSAASARVEELTQKINAIDHAKSDALAAAKFPVEGLSFDDNGVVYQGVPFSQASSAEQLRVSVAMGFAANPKLRVLLIRDGSLLDESNLKLIADITEQYDGQVWIERVSDGENVGIVIEDGMVANAAE